MIYFLRAGADGHVKIGWTKDKTTLVGRIATLQTGQPHKLHVIRTMEAARWGEAWLHGYFAGVQAVGEWFAYQDAMLTVDVPDVQPERISTEHDPRFTRNTIQVVLRVPRDIVDEARKRSVSQGQTLTATMVDAMRFAWALPEPSVKLAQQERNGTDG